MKTCSRVFCGLFFLAGLAAVGASPSGAQQSQAASRSSFDRVEIRPSARSQRQQLTFGMREFHVANMPVRYLIRYAYGLP